MPTDTDWKSTLGDVRRAYRIVVAYHNRTHHLMREIESLFPELEFASWEPSYTNRPASNLKRPMEKWTWDGVPFHNMLVYFLPRGISRNQPLQDGDWFVLAHLDSDTAVFDEEDVPVDDTGGPDPSRLTPAEKSASNLHLNAFIVDKKSAGQTAKYLWDYEETEDGVGGEWRTCNETGVRILFRSRPLDELFPDGGIQSFVSQLREDLSMAGVSLADVDQR